MGMPEYHMRSTGNDCVTTIHVHVLSQLDYNNYLQKVKKRLDHMYQLR